MPGKATLPASPPAGNRRLPNAESNLLPEPILPQKQAERTRFPGVPSCEVLVFLHASLVTSVLGAARGSHTVNVCGMPSLPLCRPERLLPPTPLPLGSHGSSWDPPFLSPGSMVGP